MTKPLKTIYEVSDVVMLIRDLDLSDGLERIAQPEVGDVGRITRIWISDPNDGDETFLQFDVKWADGRTIHAGGDEIVFWPRKPRRAWRPTRQQRIEAYEWLRRQLAGLSVTGGAA